MLRVQKKVARNRANLFEIGGKVAGCRERLSAWRNLALWLAYFAALNHKKRKFPG